MGIQKKNLYFLTFLIAWQSATVAKDNTYFSYALGVFSFTAIAAFTFALCQQTKKRIKNRHPQPAPAHPRPADQVPGNLPALAVPVVQPFASPTPSVSRRIEAPIMFDMHNHDEQMVEEHVYEDPRPINEPFSQVQLGSCMTAIITKGTQNSLRIQGTLHGIDSVRNTLRDGKLSLTRLSHPMATDPEHVAISVTSKQAITHAVQSGTNSIMHVSAKDAESFTLEQLQKHNTAIITDLQTDAVSINSAPGCAVILNGQTNLYSGQAEFAGLINFMGFKTHVQLPLICHPRPLCRHHSPTVSPKNDVPKPYPITHDHEELKVEEFGDDGSDMLGKKSPGQRSPMVTPHMHPTGAPMLLQLNNRRHSLRAASPMRAAILRRNSSADSDSQNSSTGFRTPNAKTPREESLAPSPPLRQSPPMHQAAQSSFYNHADFPSIAETPDNKEKGIYNKET